MVANSGLKETFFADSAGASTLCETFHGKIATAELSLESRASIRKCREYLEKKISGTSERFYGINTGFGDLQNKEISAGDLEQLQENLIRSHSCGIGDCVPVEIVRIMILLKIRALSFGYSGIREETVQLLLDMYSHGITPVIYTQGSLGASGDLAPLAHLSLPLIGEGEVWYQGNRMPSATAFSKAGLKPVKLGIKEGLALLNGTQFMLAYDMASLFMAENLLACSEWITAASFDAFSCRTSALDPSIHKVRRHPGQMKTAAAILAFLEGSEIATTRKDHLQDPYSFRCVPQVHGASAETIDNCRNTFQIEMDSVSDNPLIFPDEDKIISGGNFHGQPLALASDFLAIALAELGSISERRIFQLLSGKRGLPSFLSSDPGLHSGLMILQYTAAAIVSENKQLCTPASVDSIPSSNGQEDHVSMGANAAVKCFRVAENLEKILALELIAASQALSFRSPLKSGKRVEEKMNSFRSLVPVLTKDRVLSDDIRKASGYLRKAFS